MKQCFVSWNEWNYNSSSGVLIFCDKGNMWQMMVSSENVCVNEIFFSCYISCNDFVVLEIFCCTRYTLNEKYDAWVCVATMGTWVLC